MTKTWLGVASFLRRWSAVPLTMVTVSPGHQRLNSRRQGRFTVFGETMRIGKGFSPRLCRARAVRIAEAVFPVPGSLPMIARFAASMNATSARWCG